MPSEIVAALIGLAVVTIGVVGALVQFVPKYIEKQVNAKDEERQEHLQAEKEERESRLAELNARIEEKNNLVSQIAKGNELQERLIDKIVDIAREQSTNNRVVQANTNALTGHTEAIGELEKTMSKSETRLSQVEATVTSLKDEVAELNRQIKEWLTDNDKCADVDTKVTKIQGQLDEIIRLQQPTNAVTTQTVIETNATLIPDDGDVQGTAAA